MGKTKTKLSFARAARCLALSLLILLAFPAVADAVITQGFNSSQTLSAGTMVSLVNSNGGSVTPATINNSANLVGVVVPSDNSQVALSSGSDQVQVATSGISDVIVSNVNGNIVSGDEIAPSAISGVGMLASQNGEVIGTAQESFPNPTATKQTIDTSSGKKTVSIGNIPVLINVGYFTKQPNKTLIPQSIQNLANAVAGKPVKTLPIIISAVIFILTIISVVSIVYSLIHGSIISVGRNPLAQSAVYRNMLQLSALVVGIIAVAIFAIFMILTRVS